MAHGGVEVNLEWLESFSESAKQKSFSKAAKANNISQPALSKHIRNLENELDVILFHRTSSGIELTMAGKYFYSRITPILTELLTLKHDLKQQFNKQPIAIGSLPSLATYYLPSKIKEKQLSDSPLTLMIQNTSEELIESLLEGRLDAVFVNNLYTRKALYNYKLFTEPYYVVFPKEHHFKSKEAVDLNELSEEPLIIHQAPCDTREHAIKQISLLGYKPRIINEVPYGDFIYGSVMAGMGITIVPKLIASNIKHLELSALPISNFGKERTISLVTRDKALGTQLYQFTSKKIE